MLLSVDVEAFVSTWSGVSGSERANYQLFVGELCALLGVPRPDPSREDTRDIFRSVRRTLLPTVNDATMRLSLIHI